MVPLLATLAALAASGIAPAQTWFMSTCAGGGLPVNVLGTIVSLHGPQSVAVDAKGNVFFVDENDVLRIDGLRESFPWWRGTGYLGIAAIMAWPSTRS